MNEFLGDSNEYLNYQPWQTAVNPPSFRVAGSFAEYDRKMNPVLLMQQLRVKAARLPLIGSKEKVAEEERRLKAYAIAKAVNRDTLGELEIRNFFSKCDKILRL